MYLVRLVMVMGVAFSVSMSASHSAVAQSKSSEVAATKQWNHNIGDWVVACSQDAEAKKTCVLSQSLSNASTRQTLAALSFSKGATDKLQATLRSPLGVSLAEGVQMTVEGQAPFAVAYRTCLTIGCFGGFEVNPALLANLRKAGKISIAIQTPQNQALNLNFSMVGFPKAFDMYVQEAGK
jgi:invasion protein IalB